MADGKLSPEVNSYKIIASGPLSLFWLYTFLSTLVGCVTFASTCSWVGCFTLEGAILFRDRGHVTQNFSERWRQPLTTLSSEVYGGNFKLVGGLWFSFPSNFESLQSITKQKLKLIYFKIASKMKIDVFQNFFKLLKIDSKNKMDRFQFYYPPVCYTFLAFLFRSSGSVFEVISLALHSGAWVWHIALRSCETRSKCVCLAISLASYSTSS